MSVDVLRETFHATWVKHNLLEQILSPQCYRPEVIQAIETIKAYSKSTPLKTVLEEPIRQGGTPQYSHKGIPCLKTKNVGKIEINLTGISDFVSEGFAEKRRKQYVVQNDILINRSGAGSIGRTGIYLGKKKLFTNEHLIKLRIDPNLANPSYVCCFLNTWWGERALEKGVTGATGQLNLASDYIDDIWLVNPDVKAQNYIGDKVRQAERLRLKATQLLNDSKVFFLKKELQLSPLRANVWHGKKPWLTEDRLDSSHYSPPVLELISSLRAQDALLLEKYVKLIKESDFESNKPFYYFEIGNLDIDSGYAESFLVTGNAPSRAKYVVKPWDILVSTVRPERKNIGIVPPTSDNLPLVATSGFSVLRAETPEMAMFIWAYLRSDLATPQLLRWNTGAAYPAIDDDVPLKVLMPNYTHEEMISYGQKWMQIPSLYSCSQKFILAAKFFVEALIEKSLTEVELINASKSSDLDSKLLLGIRTDGYLGSGRQLFDEEELTFLSEIANNLERQED